MDEKLKEQIEKRRKENWIEAWFGIEVMAIDKDVTENSLKEHVEKLAKTENVLVYDTSFKDAVHLEKPFRDIPEAWSQVVNVKLFARDLYTFLNIVYLYGPSAIEVLGPKTKDVKIDEIQNIANTLAGLVHQFASAGVGGIVISPKT